MAAYGAVVSLLRTLDTVLHPEDLIESQMYKDRNSTSQVLYNLARFCLVLDIFMKSQMYKDPKCNACEGTTWEPVEGQFCKLKFLLLQQIDLVEWVADETNFPCLNA
ncbi:hypothetical protein BUALT_Bualt07G0036700 [Buddleja alternifolia]|uniref:Uncharacterized protein n=1 Tax=Buddleja alternifolia TaxID=168488 RepID=A0AAV6X992_9LAMI|nr:hypothetical protein BUALT_Bualt07G0036700 [Buddleja alternifolia]